MAVTRADKFTQTGKKQELFSDFLNNFDRHPITNSLARLTNEDAIKQSLKNLIYTNLGERLFEPTIGSDVLASLFEPADIITQNKIITSIQNTVKSNEPRVNLVQTVVTPNPDNNSLTVSIVFSIINNPAIQTLQFILRRVR